MKPPPGRNFGTDNSLDPPEEIPFKGRKTLLACLASRPDTCESFKHDSVHCIPLFIGPQEKTQPEALARGLNASMLALTGHDLTFLSRGCTVSLVVKTRLVREVYI